MLDVHFHIDRRIMPLKKLRKKTKSDLISSIPALSEERSILTNIHELSSGDALKRVLDHPDPLHLVQSLPEGDLFWLVKKIGGDDCIPILRLASEKQWQYLLDLELWDFDRLDLKQSYNWLRKLEKADPHRLVHWLLAEEQAFLYLFLFKNIRIEVADEDDFLEPEDGVVTLDGIFHIKVIEEGRREVIVRILNILASENTSAYQTLVSGLVGVVPSEMEEKMYRMKNVRLAEHGFLGPDEAFEIYGRLGASSLKMEGNGGQVHPLIDQDHGSLIPISPLAHGFGGDFFSNALSDIDDSQLMGSLWLEFAGLCNQVISADRTRVEDMDDLVNISEKAAGYLNMAIEGVCGTNREKARELVKNNSLQSLFRVGFSMTLELKWMVGRWGKGSWFRENGLENRFWGEEFGGILEGILEDKPRFHDSGHGGEFRFFERMDDIVYVRKKINALKGLDTLLSNLAEPYSIDPRDDKVFPEMFQSVFLTIWARRMLNLNPLFAPLSAKQTGELLKKLRADKSGPPYSMASYKAPFIRDFMAVAPDLDGDEKEALEESLTLLWDEFSEEYERFPDESPDPRFSRFILMETDGRMKDEG